MKEVNDVRSILLREEGLSLKPYKCTAGKLTIGVGRNLEDRGISEAEAFMMLDNDIARARASAEEFPWFHLLSPVRQAVVVCMIFQLGLRGFQGFRKAIAALAIGDHETAADEMKSSSWALQTPERAKRMIKLMREG